ncbi:MAG TPA: NAD-dependent DNA ligase LigA, partial [Lachnospiraceae bacterium]|nr:NAD-dependent DNA ligase LigA [Lachnospiraceae bacterium]
METNKQIDRIKDLTKTLNKYRDEYYNKSRPSVDDYTYDSLMDELKELEDAADFHCTNSPNYTVGYVVNSELPKVKHSYPLLSLDKTKDRTVAANFAKGKDTLLMHKLDGLTI